MQSKIFSIFNLLLLTILFSGCNQDQISKADLTKFLSDESYGLSITKNTGVFRLNLTYVPSQWRALNANPNSVDHTSYLKSLDKSLLFLFTISPLEGKSEGDVFLSGVNSKQDYEERVRKANFGFVESWTLILDNGKELDAVGVLMDQTNGLTNHRKFQILFDISKYQGVHASKTWDIKLNDGVFKSGIHHFVVKKEDRDRFK